jgi:hypothetical protein
VAAQYHRKELPGLDATSAVVVAAATVALGLVIVLASRDGDSPGEGEPIGDATAPQESREGDPSHEDGDQEPRAGTGASDDRERRALAPLALTLSRDSTGRTWGLGVSVSF